jgi:hypothetical protein
MTRNLTPFVVDCLPQCHTPGALQRADGMPLYAIDSKGQAWAVGSHMGRVYKTQSPIRSQRSLVHA